MTPEELEAELRRLLKDVKPFKPEWSPERIARFNLMVNDLYYENLMSKRKAEDRIKSSEKAVNDIRKELDKGKD